MKSSTAGDLQNLSIELSKLTKSLADASGSLPSYDQRQHELQLKELELSLEQLRASVAPKSKFAFKRKANPPVITEQSLLPPKPSTPVTFQVSAEAAEVKWKSTHVSLSSRSNEYLTLESLPEASSQHHEVTISQLDNCIVNLLPALDISALHIKDLTNTLLLLPAINGSIILHHLNRCTLVLACHQFRMHSSKTVDVLLNVSSNPIIEDCSGIRFGVYPTSLSAQGRIVQNSLPVVQDFSHIRPTQSPNWSLFDSQVGVWPTSPTKSREDPKKVLDNVLPNSKFQ
ncbi:tubulin binding cofactor C-domain-containing protein [Infundibulicybe gibba]|nr:tubulin binding cofactor C-domain-containing protein [Infundibulicybe gibba]